MQELFEALENADLLRGNKLSGRLATMPIKDLLMVAEQTLDLTAANKFQRSETSFTHSATGSLSGEPYPCSSMRCRGDRVEELARFAALYSDRVYIRNPFMRYFARHSSNRHPNEDRLRTTLRDNLLVLAELRPLIEAGLVAPITPPGDRCPSCLWEFAKDTPERARLEPALRSLLSEFEKKLRVSIRQVGHQYKIDIEAPADLLEHSIHRTTDDLPEGLQSNQRLRRALTAGQTVTLTDIARKKGAFAEGFAYQAFRDIIFESVLAQAVGTSFLTERSLHLRVLASIGESVERNDRNELLERHLSAVVPFAGDVPITHLVSLRKREEEAFVLFRQSLAKALAEIPIGEVSEKRARQVYSDIIQPGLLSIQRKVDLAKRDLRLSALRRAATWLGVISVGSYAGFVPAQLNSLAGFLGMAKMAQDTSDVLLAKTDISATAKVEPLYFLWEVQREANKERRQKRLPLNPRR